ncbi:MAG: flavin reductase family protein [Candidatus Kapabacteria bacterium]|nr:flavin reductase family protein [Ignavibacteriota bacterium]MCW5883346.1 flavin reductase family protein [Candidatus Kapabacteria bacterium]
MFRTINPNEIKQSEVQKWLTGGVAPRPIAFVSTISKDGIKNLSPFSFFGAFGSNPPVVAFSPSRRGRDNTLKDTYNNLIETGECVIHSVTMDIVQQMNLASSEFPPEVDEFFMAGFTPVESQIVKPFRVKESPFAMECKLLQMVELGGKHGSGNLAICEVLLFHVDESIITEDKIDPFKIRHTARNGGNWYTIADKNSMYELPKPSHDNAIGYNGLPEYIRNSRILSANDIAVLAHTDRLPRMEEIEDYCNRMVDTDEMNIQQAEFRETVKSNRQINLEDCERIIKSAIDSNDIDFALKVVVYGEFNLIAD